MRRKSEISWTCNRCDCATTQYSVLSTKYAVRIRLPTSRARRYLAPLKHRPVGPRRERQAAAFIDAEFGPDG